MSTRGCIARATGEGTFSGVYHHWDSYPKGGLGETLWKLYHGFFKRDLEAMLKFLIDDHNAWSTINNADFRLPAGYSDGPRYKKKKSGGDDYSKPIPHGPTCFCHGERHEKNDKVDQDTDSGMEWAYVFDEEKKVMHVLERVLTEDTGHDGKHMTGMFGFGAEGHQRWADRAILELDGEKPDWTKVECGESYEHCHHVASYHIKELEGTASARLSMEDYLSEHPEFGRHDAIGYIVNGQIAKDGHGGFAGGLNWKPGTQKGVWYESVRFANGDSKDVPVAYTGGGKEKPYRGVVWIFPPTLHQGMTTRPEVDKGVLEKAIAELNLVTQKEKAAA